MPQVRKLSSEEVQTIQNKGKGQRKIVEEQYDAIMGEYQAGDYGEAVLDAGENRLTVRNRLKAAATRRDLGIEFRRTTGDFIRFHIVAAAHSNGTSTPAEVPEIVSSDVAPAPAKRKGGRTKKTA